jgi:citrate synthase
MTAESMLWLLMTGQVPTPEQSHALSRELAERGELPHFVETLIDSYAFPLCVSIEPSKKNCFAGCQDLFTP